MWLESTILDSAGLEHRTFHKKIIGTWYINFNCTRFQYCRKILSKIYCKIALPSPEVE